MAGDPKSQADEEAALARTVSERLAAGPESSSDSGLRRELLLRVVTDSLADSGRAQTRAVIESIEVVTDPARSPEFNERHDALVISDEMVRAARSGTKEDVIALRRKVRKGGGFLQRYTQSDESRGRLERSFDELHPEEGGWRMLVAHAKLPMDPSGKSLGETVVAGDGHFYITPDRDAADLREDEGTAKLLSILPTGSTDIAFSHAADILKEIQENPACALLVADICSTEAAHGMGVASAIEEQAFRDARELNRNGRRRPIKYAVAAIASSKVAAGPGGAKFEFKEPINNVASLLLHTKGDLQNLAGEHLDQEQAQVVAEGDSVWIIGGGWFVTIRRIDIDSNEETHSDDVLQD